MSRSIKKGPYVEAALLKKVEALNAANKKTSNKNLEQTFDYLPTNG